jgi:putative restriction endonuclease
MTRAQLLAAFARIRVWQRGDQRAVHKPLLVLLMLARLARGEPPMVEFAAIEPQLKSLLEEFGPSGCEASRHYPFWHLKTDGLWALNGPDAIVNRPPAATPTLTELRNQHVQGGFPDGVRAAFASDPALIIEVANRILRDHFPDTIRQDVADAVGLDLDAASPGATQTQEREEIRRRDPAFREKVLLAYEYRCCVCGHDLRLGAHVIGLEAAHIKWFQARGPDVVPNGLSLCSLHHKIFDLGAFTVLPQNYQIVFSRHAIGGDATRAKLLAHHGAALIAPQSREYLPSAEFLDWHRKQVFKEPGRE